MYTRPHPLLYGVSLLIALLVAVTSAAGLLANIYPTEELRQSFLANDLVNLVIGLPMLLGSVWSARRGHLLGALFLPGTLFFVFYNATVYLFHLPLTIWFLLYLALVTLTSYTLAAFVASMDGLAIRTQLDGRIPARLIGGVLTALGVLFVLRVVGQVVNPPPTLDAERGLMVADAVLAVGWIIGGVLLWRRTALGYVTGAALLFQATLLFGSLILFLILQPLLTGAAFAAADLMVIVVMSLVVFVPFGLFIRSRVAVKQPMKRAIAR